jgi:hypothetical protein
MSEAELRKLREDFDKAAAASRGQESLRGFANNDKALSNLARRLQNGNI